jgi:hypothetical protein
VRREDREEEKGKVHSVRKRKSRTRGVKVRIDGREGGERGERE